MTAFPLAVRLQKEMARYERAISPRNGLTRRQSRAMKQSAFDTVALLTKAHDRAGLIAAFRDEGGPEDASKIAAASLVSFCLPEATPADRYTSLNVMKASLRVLAECAQAAAAAPAPQAPAIPAQPVGHDRKDVFG